MPHPHSPSALPGLALAALLLTPSVAGADVTRFDRSASVGAISLRDGVFDTPPGFEEDGFSSFDQAVTSQIGAERAVASTRATAVQGLDSASATASGSIEVQHGSVDEGRAAGGGGGASFLICVDERSTFTLQVQGNVEANAEDSSLVRADFCCDTSGAPATLEAGDGSLPRSATLSRSGVIADTLGEDCVSVVVRADSNLGNGGPDTNLPTSRVSWSLSLNVATSPQAPEASEAFLWVAGSSGAFGNPQSWDPLGPATEGVPTFVDGVRRDAAVVLDASSVTMDLAGGLARASEPRGPTGRRMGRLVRSRAPLRPVGGTLILDNLDIDIQGMAQTVDGRSLEVGGGATVNLDEGIVQARHVAIGSGGDGTLTVQGPDGGFTTLGRFGLGADADGNVDITNGATVTTAETVLGEVDGQGSARIAGSGSFWRTGNFAVGLEDDASLTIEAGARVESDQVVLGFNLDGEERARAIVRGPAAGGAPTWRAQKFEIRPRGELVIESGGHVEATNFSSSVSIGGEGADADCILGQACLQVKSGRLTAPDLEIGEGGGGEVRIEPEGRVELAGVLFLGATTEGDGKLIVTGPSAVDQLVADVGMSVAQVAGGRGKVELRNGAKVRLKASFLVAANPVDAFGALELIGDPANPTATRLGVDIPPAGEACFVGSESSEPAGQVLAPTGEIRLQNALIELTGAADLVIERRGLLLGLGGGRVSIPAGNALFNRGVVSGALTIAGDYVQEGQGSRASSVAVTGTISTQLSPLEASRFARAVRRRPAPPPAPPSGPLVVTGDATLDGLLELQFLNNAAPRAGDTFDVLDVGGAVTGGFANTRIRGLVPGSFDLQPSTVDGVLTLTSLTDAVALPTVSLTGKTKLKETKKAGLKVKVARSGDTSAPLLVAYTIGGTATNEIDYERLPGTIEIPAGKKSAKILVRPRADDLLEGPETIELELVPGDDYALSLFSKVAIELQSKKAKR